MYILHLHKSFLKFITECTIFPFNTIWNCLPKKWRKNARLLFPFSYFHFILSCILLHVGVYILAQKILISPPNGRKYFPDFFSRYSLKILPFINFLSKVPPPVQGEEGWPEYISPDVTKKKKRWNKNKKRGDKETEKGKKIEISWNTKKGKVGRKCFSLVNCWEPFLIGHGKGFQVPWKIIHPCGRQLTPPSPIIPEDDEEALLRFNALTHGSLLFSSTP